MVMEGIEFLEDWFNNVVEEKGLDTAIQYLQI